MFAQSATSECLPTVVRTSRILDLVAQGLGADPDTPLLIRGERSVGKDSLARLIHAESPRRNHIFVKVNCRVEPADHHEADLFGHEKGASPQAARRRLGSLELAHEGTLYMDEIGAMPCSLVPKLLQALRSREVSRCGGAERIPIDARVIASTSQTTGAGDGVWQGLRDLSAVEICVPPLRQRADEIPVFASFFLERLNRRYRRNVCLSPDVLADFQGRPWPGNLDELEEEVYRLVTGGVRAPVH